jgi:DNA-binding response OmpR family regulator
MKVLLVDDEEDLVSALAERLAFRDIDAAWCTSGEDALEILKTQAFDLAVIDVKMPKMDGLQLKKRIQGLYPHMKFIFLTGHGSSNDFESGSKEVGSSYYLVKPINIDVLVKKIKQALQC